MGKKIFISYKYGDTQVQKLPQTTLLNPTRVRDYVDIIQRLIEKQGDHINKGEKDGESLSTFQDAAIQSLLSNKIYDSTVTIVLISKEMKEGYWKPENDQWIPWEIAYSLRNKTRNGIQSKKNAVLAVVLPDWYGSYSYALDDNFHFNIMKKNRKNLKVWYPSNVLRSCSESYIFMVNWNQFVSNINVYIDVALEIRQNIDKYDINTKV